jgi:centromere-localized protein 2
MAPTEQTILSTFLLTQSNLPEIFTFQSFASHFPKAQQSSPEIKRLYRTLQHRRALITDAVAQNIEDEVERGNAQREVVVRARRAAERQEKDEEVAIEKVLFGATSSLPASKQHTLTSILPSLEAAAEGMTAAIARLEREAAELLSEIRSTVGGLSDLRYGKFATPSLNEEVIGSLDGLENICDTR